VDSLGASAEGANGSEIRTVRAASSACDKHMWSRTMAHIDRWPCSLLQEIEHSSGR